MHCIRLQYPNFVTQKAGSCMKQGSRKLDRVGKNKNSIIMETKNKKHFFVSLEGVDLSDEQLKRIDKGIQQVVLSELSKIDHSNEFVVTQQLSKIGLNRRNWPFPWGIIIRKPDISFDEHILDLSERLHFK